MRQTVPNNLNENQWAGASSSMALNGRSGAGDIAGTKDDWPALATE
jgi:hypothetical protein